MSKLSFMRVLLLALTLFMSAGCGEGPSNTNGLLVLNAAATQIATGVYQVNVTASYSAAGAASLSGVPIRVSINVNGDDFANEYFTDASGSVSAFRNVGQSNQDIVVLVTATTGGLRQSQTVAVPAL
uniref:Lipoprotein n=1 Tax=Geobacter sp. (strain M21) TaxID=443144 RepID=C6E0S6_GEOSM